MEVRVLLFASVRQSAGGDEIRIDVPDGTTAGDLLDRLREKIPALEGLADRIKLAVNEEFVDRSYEIQPGDEVAVIPPMSGG
ncbi:MAG: molybdopterin converting factor subunit 1 [Planctomycetota bacterium]|nr:molybdopterin converting factor subunit 1 [Planctomycetota bacterium]